jgi:hypothetical protein
VFAAFAMLLRLTIRAEKSPRRIASVGTVKICGSGDVVFKTLVRDEEERAVPAFVTRQHDRAH